MFLEQFCACLSAFKLDTFSVSHGNSLYAGIPHSLLYFTLAQGPESARKRCASAFALLVSCCTCFRFVCRTFVIYLLKVVGFSGWLKRAVRAVLAVLADCLYLQPFARPRCVARPWRQRFVGWMLVSLK